MTRLEAEHGSSYPGNLALGAVDDVALTEAVAGAIAGELAAAGVNLNLAPVADANTNPLNPVIGVRSFGADPRARRASRRCVRHRHAAPGRGGLREALPRPRGHGCGLAPRAPGDRGRPRRGAAAVPRRDRRWDSGRDARPSARARPGRRAGEPQRADPVRAAARRARLRRSDRHRRARDGRRQLDLRRRGSGRPRADRRRGLARARPRPARGRSRAGACRDRRRRPHWSARRGAPGGGSRPRRRTRPVGVADERRRTPAAQSAPKQRGARSRSSGDVTIAGPILVLELIPEANIAAGRSRARPGRRPPDAVAVQLRGATGDLAAVLAEHDGRRLVVVTRDAARHAWQAETVAAATALRPDLVVVETGIPGSRPDAGAFIATLGAGRANLEAMAAATR